MDLGTIWASVGLKTAPLEAGVTRAKGMMRGLDASLANLGGMMAGAVAIAGIAAIGAGLASCVKEAMEAEKVLAETNAIIKTTGGVANVTASEIEKLSGKIRDKTGYDDEQIQSAANMLLTFPKVRNEVGASNDIFSQALDLSTDMARKFGMEVPQAAKLLGKALGEPVRGVTALQRMGVMLTDQQKEQVKAFVASGDILSAQKVILGEVATEVGLVAEAYGSTLAGKIDIAKSKFGDMKEAIGNALLPILSDLMTKMSTWDWEGIGKGIGTAITDIGKFAGVIGDLYSQIVKFGSDTATGVINAIENIKRVLGGEPTIGAEHRIADETKKGMQDTLKVIQAATPETKSAMAQYASVLATKDEGPTPEKSAAVDSLDNITKGILAKIPEAKGNIDQFSHEIILGIEQYGSEFATAGADVIGKYAEGISRSSGLPQGVIEAMLLQIQSFINGTPLVITPEVKIDKFKTPTDMFKDIMSGQTAAVEAKINVDTAQASQNVTGLKANMETIQDKGVTASTETAQASQNVTGLRNNIAGLTDKTVTLTVITKDVKTNQSPEKTWSSAFAAGEYIAGEIGAGMQANAPTVSAMVTGGIGGASAALTSTFGSFISEMNAAPILEVENALKALAVTNWDVAAATKAADTQFEIDKAAREQQIRLAEDNLALAPDDQARKDAVAALQAADAQATRTHEEEKYNRALIDTTKSSDTSLASWRNANAAYKTATAGLAKYTNAIKSHEGIIAGYNRTLAGLDKQTAKYNSQIEKLDESTKPYEKQISKLDKQTAAYEKQVRDLDDQTAAYESQIRDLGDTTTAYERQSRDLDDQLKVLDKSLQDSETRASAYQETLDKFSSIKFTGEGAAADESFAQDEESKKLQLEIMKAEDAHNYALAAKLTIQKDALDRKKEEAALQTSITYDPQRRELEQLLDPLHGQEATEAEIVAQITAATAGLGAEKAIQETLKLQQDEIKAKQEAIALLERGIADTVEQIKLAERNIADTVEEIKLKERDVSDIQDGLKDKIQLIVDKEDLLQDKVEKIEDKQQGIKDKIAAQEDAVAKLNKEYDNAKEKVDAFKKQIDDLASFFVSKYQDMAYVVGQLNTAIAAANTAASSSTIPSYQTGTSYVPSTGLAVVHKGEQITPALRPMQTPSGGGTTIVNVNSILDGKIVAKSVTKILGGNASAYAASGGRY